MDGQAMAETNKSRKSFFQYFVKTTTANLRRWVLNRWKTILLDRVDTD